MVWEACFLCVWVVAYQNFYSNNTIFVCMLKSGRCLALVFLLVSVACLGPLSARVQSVEAPDLFLEDRLVVALTLQEWDYMDRLCYYFFMFYYENRLSEIERQYDIECDVQVFWDSRDGGDVQDGLLERLDVDVLIGPGGVGSLHTPYKYRSEIRQFIHKGGGFIGVCGDSYLCTGGAVNDPWYLKLVLLRLFGYAWMTPPLMVSNMRSDSQALVDVFSGFLSRNNIAVVGFLAGLFLSNAEMYIPEDSNLPFGKSLAGQKISVMAGMTPLVDGPDMLEWLYPKDYVIGVFGESKSPYDELDLMGKYAMVATEYGKGRVVASPVHSEISPLRVKAHQLFNEAVLWAGGYL